MSGSSDALTYARDYLPPSWFGQGKNEQVHTNVILEEVAVERLTIDPRFQRHQVFPGEYVLRLASSRCAEIKAIDASWGIIAKSSTADAAPSSIHLQVVQGSEFVSLLLRVIRDLAQHVLRRDNFVMMHGAVVARQGVAIALVGDKGAGKTPSALRFLRAGWDLVANDRYLLHLGERMVVPFPIAALVHEHSLHLLPAILRNHPRVRTANGKYRFSPRALASGFQVDYPGTAKLGRFCFLESVAGPEELTVGDHAELEEVLRRNTYEAADPTFGLDWAMPSKAEPLLPNAATPCLEGIPWSKLKFNFEAVDALQPFPEGQQLP